METQKNSSTYREVLRQALAITKRYKYLWFFGFFVSFLGAGGEFESLFRNYSDLADRSRSIISLQNWYQGGLISAIYGNIQDFFSAYPWQAFFSFLMVLVIGLVLLWLAIVSQIALFDAANKISKNKPVSYNDGYQVGNRHFGSVLLINIIAKVVLYALLVVVGAPLLSWFLLHNELWGGLIFVFVVFFLYVPFSIIVSFIIKYAVAYIIIQEKKTGEAVRLGWELFKKNWLISVEMAFLILGIGILVGLGILVIMGLVAVPFALIAIAALFFSSGTAFAIAVVLGLIAWLIVATVIGSAFVTFQYSAWTMLFLKLNEARAQSKLLRWFGKFSFGKP